MKGADGMRGRTILPLLAVLLLILLYPSSMLGESIPDSERPSPVYRALLIACDEYVSFPDTTPTAHNNLLAMETLLEHDPRGFIIRRQDGITQSAEALRAAISWTFRDAGEDDVSYLYISSHGAISGDVSDQRGELILSDGVEEARITAPELQAMLDPIPGVKLLIVDACYSGALIDKGFSPGDTPAHPTRPFSSLDYKALVSSGASEPSWYWTTGADVPPLGSSYFTMALAEGAGLTGEHAADRNRDGDITLNELYQYLRVNYAAATAQVTPFEDDFVVFSYDINKADAPNAPLGGFVFDSAVLNPNSMEIKFSFTASKAARVGYQLVFMRDGVWDWRNAVLLWDSDDYPNRSDGSIRPGRKQRKLSLNDISSEDWDYAMLNIIRYENGKPVVCASRVISMQRLEGDPSLEVKLIQGNSAGTSGLFDPRQSPLTVWVGHDFPLSLTVKVIQLETGKTVRWLSVSQATRPQGLSPSGSLFYWDGMDQNGIPAAPGEYAVFVSSRAGKDVFCAAQTIFISDTVDITAKIPVNNK